MSLSGREDEWGKQKYSGPIAYAIQSHIIPEHAGSPRQTDCLNMFVDLPFGHADLRITKNYLDSDPDE